jgi:hypothetical protein
MPHHEMMMMVEASFHENDVEVLLVHCPRK